MYNKVLFFCFLVNWESSFACCSFKIFLLYLWRRYLLATVEKYDFQVCELYKVCPDSLGKVRYVLETLKLDYFLLGFHQGRSAFCRRHLYENSPGQVFSILFRQFCDSYSGDLSNWFDLNDPYQCNKLKVELAAKLHWGHWECPSSAFTWSSSELISVLLQSITIVSDGYVSKASAAVALL